MSVPRNVVVVPRSFARSVPPPRGRGCRPAENGALSSQKASADGRTVCHSRLGRFSPFYSLPQNNAQSVPREGRGRAQPGARAFNFSQLSVRLLSAPFPFMYSKFPLRRNGRIRRPPALRPPQLEGGWMRRSATLMTSHLPL